VITWFWKRASVTVRKREKRAHHGDALCNCEESLHREETPDRASINGGGASAKTAAAEKVASTNGRGERAKTAAAAVSASTNGKGVGAKTAESASIS